MKRFAVLFGVILSASVLFAETQRITLKPGDRLEVEVEAPIVEPTPDPEPEVSLTPPASLKAENIGDELAILLTWENTAVGADKVVVMVKAAKGPWPYAGIAVLPADATSYRVDRIDAKDFGLHHNWEYDFIVVPALGTEVGDASDPVRIQANPEVKQQPSTGPPPSSQDIPSGVPVFTRPSVPTANFIKVTSESAFAAAVEQGNREKRPVVVEDVVFTKTIKLDYRSNIWFVRCTFRVDDNRPWPFNNGLFLANCSDIKFLDCLWTQVPHQGIEGYHLRDVHVWDSAFDKVWEGIHTMHGNDNLVVARNYFVRIHRMPVEVQGGGSLVWVAFNWVEKHDNVYNDSFGLSLAANETSEVYALYNTLIADSPSNWRVTKERYGMGLEIGGRKALAYRNVIWGPWVCGISTLSNHNDSVKSRVTVQENTISGIRSEWGSNKEIINDGGSHQTLIDNVISYEPLPKPERNQ